MTARALRFGAVTLRTAGPLSYAHMEERHQRNRMVPALTSGLVDAIAAAGADEATRVVVLYGLPEVFCAGATREDLLGTSGRHTYSTQSFLRCLAECPVPVVAAVQGHAIGGGLLLALYADIAVFSDRSRYAANFISYGFTPVGGATYVLRAKLGAALGTEMLLTGRSYPGRALAQRGAGVAVVPHDDVPDAARRIALRVAAAPRRALTLLKQALADNLLKGTDAAIQLEYPSHVETISAPAALDRVTRLYPSVPQPARDRPTPASRSRPPQLFTPPKDVRNLT